MITTKYSNLKIVNHPKKLNSLKNNEITSPIYVRVKPTNRCNHDCFFCVYKSSFSNMHELSKDRESNWVGNISEISKEKLIDIIDDFNEIGVKSVTYSGGGEPLLHPHITEVMDYTLKKNIDLSIITNGQLLRNERAEVLSKSKWVRVSVDYCNEDQFSKHRNVTPRLFYEVLKNIKNFSQIKNNTCDLFINYIVHKGNYKNLIDAVKIYKENGVQNIRFSPIWVPDFLTYHLEINKEVSDQLVYISNNFCSDNFTVNTTYDLFSSCNQIERKYNRCYFSQIVPVIGADLNVYSCHNKAYDKQGLIGSIKEQSFKECWFSDKTKNFFNNLNPINVCKHQCANDKKNLIIKEIMECNDNFI